MNREIDCEELSRLSTEYPLQAELIREMLMDVEIGCPEQDSESAAGQPTLVEAA